METIESLQAQVSAFTAENLALKAQITAYYNANCALGYQNAQLQQVGHTAVVVVEENIALKRENEDLQAKLKQLKGELSRVERARQVIITAVREGLPKRR